MAKQAARRVRPRTVPGPIGAGCVGQKRRSSVAICAGGQWLSADSASVVGPGSVVSGGRRR